MDTMWIGAVSAQEVTGTVGFGYTCLTGARTVSKSNVGNGSVTGDGGYLPVLMAIVSDPDVWDCLLMTEQPGR